MALAKRKAHKALALNQDQRGTVSIMFATMVSVILLCIGLALDYGRAVSARAELQQDLDAAMLRVATNAEAQSENFDWRSALQQVMAQQGRSMKGRKSISLEVSKAGAAVVSDASYQIDTSLMRIGGVKKLDVVARSAISATEDPADVALILDNTDSMEGAKLAGVQAASHALIDAAYERTSNHENVKISVVPFSDYINVGVQNRDAPWIKGTDDHTVTQEIAGYFAAVGVGCKPGTERVVDQIVGYSDGVPIIEKRTMCDADHTETVWQEPKTVTTNHVWKGCVGPRPNPIELTDGGYDSEKVPGITDPAITCPSAITPLSSDAATIKAGINALAPTGATYIPLGLMWGMRALSQQEPFATDAPQPGKGKPRKIVVLMTDGENTVAQGDFFGNGGENTSPFLGSRNEEAVKRANAMTLAACAAAKAAGAEIRVVGFEVATPEARAMLRSCASTYYEAADVAALTKVFKEIGETLTPLRLTQ